ncbi:MAG: PIN domain-containing protein [archaeon]
MGSKNSQGWQAKVKLVADTNILFSFFWKNSITRKLLLTLEIEFTSPEIAEKELKKYSDEIIRKAGITKETYHKELKHLKEIVKFTNKKEYATFIEEARKITPDEDDAEFFALCLKHSCFLWSNDSLLKNQEKIKVLSTEEVINSIF